LVVDEEVKVVVELDGVDGGTSGVSREVEKLPTLLLRLSVGVGDNAVGFSELGIKSIRELSVPEVFSSDVVTVGEVFTSFSTLSIVEREESTIPAAVSCSVFPTGFSGGWFKFGSSYCALSSDSEHHLNES